MGACGWVATRVGRSLLDEGQTDDGMLSFLYDCRLVGKVSRGHMTAVGAGTWRQELADEQIIHHDAEQSRHAQRHACRDGFSAEDHAVDRLGREADGVRNGGPSAKAALKKAQSCADVGLFLLIEVAHV